VSPRNKVDKKPPTGAAPAAITFRPFLPALPTLARTPPEGSNWVHECKWDGFRAVIVRQNAAVGIWSRNNVLWNKRIPALVDAISALPGGDLQLDGELIAVRGGRHDFHAVRGGMSSSRARSAKLVLMLFDLIHVDDQSLRNSRLIDRKELLRALLCERPNPLLQYSDHFTGSGAELFLKLHELGYEGMVSKRADSIYRGGRTRDWIKVKGRSHVIDESAAAGLQQRITQRLR